MKSRLMIVFAGAMLAFTSSISPTLALKSSSQLQNTEIANTVNTQENLLARRSGRRRVFLRTRCGSWDKRGRLWFRQCVRYRCRVRRSCVVINRYVEQRRR